LANLTVVHKVSNAAIPAEKANRKRINTKAVLAEERTYGKQ
jgi:hypothetical protein